MIDKDEYLAAVLALAREEAYLWEVPLYLREQFPQATIDDCWETAKDGVGDLVRSGIVAVVPTSLAQGGCGDILVPIGDALQLLSHAATWTRPDDLRARCFSLTLMDAGIALGRPGAEAVP